MAGPLTPRRGYGRYCGSSTGSHPPGCNFAVHLAYGTVAARGSSRLNSAIPAYPRRGVNGPACAARWPCFSVVRASFLQRSFRVVEISCLHAARINPKPQTEPIRRLVEFEGRRPRRVRVRGDERCRLQSPVGPRMTISRKSSPDLPRLPGTAGDHMARLA